MEVRKVIPFMPPIKTTQEFFATAGQLIDLWCEQRRLGPLSLILPTYLDPNNLTDGWYAKYDALKNLRAFCRDNFQMPNLKR